MSFGTEQPHAVAPTPPVPSKSEVKTSDWIGGVLISVLVPIIGLIVGAVYISKGGAKKQVGIMCVVISLGMAALWAVVTAAG
jgi:tellurite resistance protein TehA-like permease